MARLITGRPKTVFTYPQPPQKKRHKSRLQTFAAEMRYRRPTTAEKRLAKMICRDHDGIRFFGQCPITKYIADFYCPAARLVVEVDGSHHFKPAQKAYDDFRQEAMYQRGIKTIRFTNKQVLEDLSAVLDHIYTEASKRVYRKNQSL